MRNPSIAAFKQTWLGLILICLLCASLSGQQAERIPQLSLPRLEGQTLRSEDLKDNIVVLDFWATWCEACVSEIPEFNKLEKEYSTRGVRVIGLAVQSGWASDIQKFVKQYNMRYTVLVGERRYRCRLWCDQFSEHLCDRARLEALQENTPVYQKTRPATFVRTLRHC